MSKLTSILIVALLGFFTADATQMGTRSYASAGLTVDEMIGMRLGTRSLTQTDAGYYYICSTQHVGCSLGTEGDKFCAGAKKGYTCMNKSGLANGNFAIQCCRMVANGNLGAYEWALNGME